MPSLPPRAPDGTGRYLSAGLRQWYFPSRRQRDEGSNPMLRPILLIVALLTVGQVLAAPASAEDSKAPALTYSPWTKVCARPPDQGAKQVCLTGKYGRSEVGTPVVAAALLETEGVAS
jgi:hypothetical protein